MFVAAAHCLHRSRKPIPADKLIFVLGKHNIKKWTLSEGEKMVEAKEIRVHPDYVPLTSDADIAVVVLSEDLQFTKYIRPICMWSGSDDVDRIVGQQGKVVGWGRDETDSVMTAEPRQINIPVVSQEQCLRSAEAFAFITSSRTFCAGTNASRPDAKIIGAREASV
jgi:secreted trypsin-like serine protease